LSAEKFGRFLSEAGDDLEVRFYKTCAQELASRFRSVSSDYLTAQQLLWKHALRKT
jgi:hypothetical protein